MVGRWSGIRSVAGLALIALAIPIAATVPAAAADVVAVRVSPLSAAEARAGQFGTSIMQTERFDELAAGSGVAFTSSFGSGAFSGTYSGDFVIAAAGAGNTNGLKF